jgi:hypothetical protein
MLRCVVVACGELVRLFEQTEEDVPVLGTHRNWREGISGRTGSGRRMMEMKVRRRCVEGSPQRSAMDMLVERLEKLEKRGMDARLEGGPEHAIQASNWYWCWQRDWWCQCQQETIEVRSKLTTDGLETGMLAPGNW